MYAFTFTDVLCNNDYPAYFVLLPFTVLYVFGIGQP